MQKHNPSPEEAELEKLEDEEEVEKFFRRRREGLDAVVEHQMR
jgi:hypothetical protein